MKKENLVTGTILILLGFAFLITKYIFNVELIHFESGDFWPLIVLGIGVVFELLYFSNRRITGFLVPGGVLTTLGVLFLFEVATDWVFSAYTWPVYLFAVSVGLFQLYLFGGRPKGLLIAGSIVGGVGVFSLAIIIFEVFVSAVDIAVVIPLVLIAAGLLFIFGRRRGTNTKTW